MDNNGAILWMIPLLPLLAAGWLAVYEPKDKRTAAYIAIWAMGFSFLFSYVAMARVLATSQHQIVDNFTWLTFGETALRLGVLLDPLSAIMVLMVTFVGTLIFIFSIGYMKEDANFSKFFCYLSLFAAAMLGLVVANNLLLLFMCWELVGVSSYLLIGFWYHKPSAAAAAKKAFVTTRIGDLGFFIGMLWLYAETGTLLFYDNGVGCLEQSAIAKMIGQTTFVGMTVATAISLLIFCGAMGKSGQVPLHVWLPDAMEGPTPVSALIHAATMVAAGVFLVARMYPLMSALPAGVDVAGAMKVVTWVGAFTAVFAALIAVAQTDIKRVLAYSTVSQLGYMFLGLGTGGVAVGMFHLITHAFFKALLFLGAGSVIHGCHHEQDIRRMGGLFRKMPVTFATYSVGMMALAGFPLLFSGFWSKDEILHAAWSWPVSNLPFWMGVFGALLTAFYMTRQMIYVFFGDYRGKADEHHAPHESPLVMIGPLAILAVLAVLLGFFGTPIWPLFQGFITQTPAEFQFGELFHWGTIGIIILSTCVVGLGVGLAWWYYGILTPEKADEPDPLGEQFPKPFGVLSNCFGVDEFYRVTFVKWLNDLGLACEWLERKIFSGAVTAVTLVALGISWMSRFFDEYVINPGFDRGCEEVRRSGRFFSEFQSGQIHQYLRVFGVALALLLFFLVAANQS